MKKIIYIMLSGFLLLSACRDESLDPRPVIEENIGAVTLVEVDPENSFFNFLNPDFGSEAVNFEVDVDNFDVTEIESVDVLLEFVEVDAIYDPFREEFVDSVYAPVVLETISTFPANVSITAQEAANALGVDISKFKVGDNFTITFPINTADGRRLTVALASDLCNQPAQPSFGGCAVQWAIACPSDFGGEYNYTITSASLFGEGTAADLDNSGTLVWTDLGAGVYTWSSFTFGGYQLLYGCCEQEGAGSAIRMIDVCNTLSLTDDSFACGWAFTAIEVNGPTLTLTVEGGCIDVYTIEITRPDGSSWPSDLSI